MSKCSHLNALFVKNLTIMKRNTVSTICEFLFPIILMVIAVLVRQAFEIEKHYYSEMTDSEYLESYSSSISQKTFSELKKRKVLSICQKRPAIAIIGKSFPERIKNKIQGLINEENPSLLFIYYDTPDDFNTYIRSEHYNSDMTNYPPICFGIHFEQSETHSYNLSLHYFSSKIRSGTTDIPSTLIHNLDPFQNGPDMESYEKYVDSGYLTMMQFLYEEILKVETNDNNAEIGFGVVPQKYEMYQEDTFGRFIGFILPFFLVIAYLFPLSLQVFRMVNEKETKAKEGMKIMGLSESIYFLSYFIQYLVITTIYALINAAILLKVFQHCDYVYLLGFFWMYGMNVFALGYFFQGLMDKTRLAMIVSILIYFIMYFVSVAVISEEVGNTPKMFISLLPPTALQLGINTIAQFDSNGLKFTSSSTSVRYNNFSVNDMYIMLCVDFFIYMFLGFYLQNIISHDFGIKKPFYFLCTKKFWGCNQTETLNKKVNEMEDVSSKELKNDKSANCDDEFFQNEDLYHDKIKPNDKIQIKNLKKQFDDGKVAVNGVSLNLYKDETFALLGHNGAGKSTMISMLSGLYDSTEGEALYDSMNILTNENMDIFRKKLGICPQHDVLFEDLTVEEHLNMFSVFKGVDSKEQIKLDITKSLTDFKMNEYKDTIVKNLSAGQRRKLSILIALIGGSEVIFLDEPSSGMDITSRRNLWDILKQCAKNKIIVLTTHYMEEAAVLGKRIGIISDGVMKCVGSPLFLIEKFGKFISVNVYKEPNANNDDIVTFFKEKVNDLNLQVEVLSEEILFRIPKKTEKGEFNISSFFKDLDDNINGLKIKTYSASMPTLEDVFLNVSSMKRIMKEKGTVNATNSKSDSTRINFSDNDKILFDDSNYNVVSSPCRKFSIDLGVSLKKRSLQIIRDIKSFLLEVLCPILLVLIGLAVSSVEYFREEKNFVVRPTSLLSSQTIYYNRDITVPSEVLSKDKENTVQFELLEKKISTGNKVIDYMNDLYQKNDTNNYGAYYFTKLDKINNKYEFISLINAQARQSAIVYNEFMLNNIVKYASTNEVTITFMNSPIPKTLKEKNDGQERNNATLVFFVAVAFALIPANFITIIIKEREKNTKHLQIISGISLISYWFSNFIFELVKYYFTGGINLILIYLFDFFPKYLYALYLLYGPAMVSFTYLFSFMFDNESSAQNMVILLNFLFGALAGCVVLILRIMDNVVTIGKVLSYIFRLVPSFCFCYGYNELLTENNLLYIDQPQTWMTLKKSAIIGLKYVGADCLYMGIETVVFLVLLALFEMKQSGMILSETDNKPLTRQKSIEMVNINPMNDSQVLKEIERANKEPKDGSPNYAIKVQHLSKNYYKGLCGGNATSALKDISFCLEYGECFGFLGINGAGKTTTFKCLTNEIAASKGNIMINGKNIKTNFNEVRALIGYCPQFDAIFEYMTVYENLEFYAKIKGIVEGQLKNVITALMIEMNLIEYKDKISGNLSGGNKRKLSVSIAMICNPSIVLLDEPSTGMDPEARRFMWGVIHKISTRSKKSSVIMTTHSMDEAETLCRRIGILVNGSFKCMGSSNYIKEKYGEGYEINLQISPLSEGELEKILKSKNISKETEVTEENLISYLKMLDKEHFAREFDNSRKGFGWKLLKELKSNKQISVIKIISWCYYVTNVLNVVKKLREYFKVITLCDYVDNTFMFKIKKTNEMNEKSIGFLFGLIEEMRKDFDISEYLIQQTSLEQIFNKFANDNIVNKENESINMDDKADIEINSILLKDLLLLN